MRRDPTSVREGIGEQIRESAALRAWSLPLAVLASVVGTLLTPVFGAGRLGSLLSAAAGPAVTALFTTLSCDETAVGDVGRCPALPVRSNGTETLQITGVAVESADGTPTAEFQATTSCVGALAPQASCAISVEFRPEGDGPRQATLVIHQNLPGPANRVALHGVGRGSDGPPPSPSMTPGPASLSPPAVG